MAIAHDADSSGSGTTNQLIIAHTISGANRALIIGFLVSAGSDTVTSITYDGVAVTKINHRTNSNNSTTAHLYYILAPHLGTHNIVINLSGSVFIDSGNVSLTGVGAIQPDASVTNTASGTNSAANTLTTIADNTVHVASYAVDAFTLTSVTNGTMVGDILGYSAVITPAGSHTLTGNSSGGNNNWATVGASFSPGTQGSAGTARNLMGVGS